MDTAPKKASKIFLKAAIYIRTYGWQEKGMGTPGGPRCSMGALASAQSGVLDSSVAALMYRALYKRLNGIGLTEFNSRAHAEDVASLFEETAGDLCRA